MSQVRKAKLTFLHNIMRTKIQDKKDMILLQNYEHELKKSQYRLAELHTKGVIALSRYDIEIAHQGDAEEALIVAKRLVSNHVQYFKRKIAELEKQPTQLPLI
jgi:hypothetical protein